MEALNLFMEKEIAGITVGEMLFAVAVCGGCLLLCKVLMGFLRRAYEHSKIERTLYGFVRPALKATLLFLTAVLTLGVLGVPVTSLVALFSVVGVAVSLAVQDTLSNLFSGVQLLTVRPFNVGDYVDAGTESGTVVEIGMINTKLATADNKVIQLPNSAITKNRVVNYNANDRRRIDLRICAAEEHATETVKAALLAAAEYIQYEQLPAPPFATIDSFGQSGIVYLLRLWVKNDVYWNEYYRLNEAVRSEFEKAQIHMVFNRMQVSLQDENH